MSLTTARAVHHLRRAGHVVQLIRPRQSHEASRSFEDTEHPGDHTFDNGEWRTASAPIPMYPGLRFGWATVGALRERWQQTAPQLVHVATPGPLAWSALRAAKAEGLPSTADFRTNFHAYSQHYGLGWLQPAVLAYLRQLHNMAHRTFVPTRSLADELTARGFQRPSVISRGVDAGLFSPAERDDGLRDAWGVGPSDRVLLYVGRLTVEKNVSLALETFEYLRRRHPGLRMVVAGEGPLRAKLAAAHPDVRFVGVQRASALARCYASADVFLFPSVTDTFGNVVLEALASGLAVVAFDSAGAGTLIDHGHDGWLAQLGDRGSFFHAAELALGDSALGCALRQRARMLALRSDWESALHAFEQQLSTVLAQALSGSQVRDAALA
ncbi:glycosyltransferase family 1 protein [Ideonella sp.]|uniref:glycosyltransferase family 4 protein n=1 Tax=Ideonella sp. TaxID=1929293 RepID=UPI002E378245|nr:glycosyltransferase family 1 protein [Ideonella sp.]